MTTLKVCDVCGQQRVQLPFKVTENDTGKAWDACSAACYLAGPPPEVPA